MFKNRYINKLLIMAEQSDEEGNYEEADQLDNAALRAIRIGEGEVPEMGIDDDVRFLQKETFKEFIDRKVAEDKWGKDSGNLIPITICLNKNGEVLSFSKEPESFSYPGFYYSIFLKDFHISILSSALSMGEEGGEEEQRMQKLDESYNGYFSKDENKYIYVLEAAVCKWLLNRFNDGTGRARVGHWGIPSDVEDRSFFSTVRNILDYIKLYIEAGGDWPHPRIIWEGSSADLQKENEERE